MAGNISRRQFFTSSVSAGDIPLTLLKVISSGGVVMPDGQDIKCIEKDCSYKYLGILETDGVRHGERKEQTRK